jgi:hypothetical protein
MRQYLVVATGISGLIFLDAADAQSSSPSFCAAAGSYMREIAVRRAAGATQADAVRESAAEFDALAAGQADVGMRRRVLDLSGPLAAFASDLAGLQPTTVQRIGEQYCVARGGNITLAPAASASRQMAAVARECEGKAANSSSELDKCVAQAVEAREVRVASSPRDRSASSSRDRSGGYMGFSIGSFSYEEEDETGTTFVDDTTSAFRIMGGYRFNDSFALEGGWGKTGDLKTTFTDFVPGFGNLTLNMSGDYEVLTVRALGIVPFEKVSLVGGVGFYDAELNAQVSLTGFTPVNASASDNGATLVGGLEVNLGRVDIRAELEWFDADDGIDARDVSVGVLFQF